MWHGQSYSSPPLLGDHGTGIAMPSTRWPLSPEPSVPMCPVRTFCCHGTDKAANLTIRQDSGSDLPKGQGLRLKHPGGILPQMLFPSATPDSIPFFAGDPNYATSSNPGRRTGLSCQRNKRYSYKNSRHPLTVDSAILIPSCSLQLSVVRNRTGCFIGDYLHGYYPGPRAFIPLPFLSTPGQHPYSVVFRYSARRKSVVIFRHPRPLPY